MAEMNWDDKEISPFKQRQKINTFTEEEIARARELAEISTRRKIEANVLARKQKKSVFERIRMRFMQRKKR